MYAYIKYRRKKVRFLFTDTHTHTHTHTHKYTHAHAHTQTHNTQWHILLSSGNVFVVLCVPLCHFFVVVPVIYYCDIILIISVARQSLCCFFLSNNHITMFIIILGIYFLKCTVKLAVSVLFSFCLIIIAHFWNDFYLLVENEARNYCELVHVKIWFNSSFTLIC